MRQSFSILVIVALSVSLLGCGSESTKSTGGKPTQAQLPQPRPTNSIARATQPLLKGLPDPQPKTRTDPEAKAKLDPPADPAQFDADLVRKINELRTKASQQPISFNATLTKIAQEHAKLMAKEKRPDVNPAKPVIDQIKDAGYKFKALGLSQSGVRQLNATAVYDAMINQQRLGEQFVKPDFNDIGVGVDFDGKDMYYIAIIYAGEQK